MVCCSRSEPWMYTLEVSFEVHIQLWRPTLFSVIYLAFPFFLHTSIPWLPVRFLSYWFPYFVTQFLLPATCLEPSYGKRERGEDICPTVWGPQIDQARSSKLVLFLLAHMLNMYVCVFVHTTKRPIHWVIKILVKSISNYKS